MENKKIVDYIIITFEQEHFVVIEVLNKIKEKMIYILLSMSQSKSVANF